MKKLFLHSGFNQGKTQIDDEFFKLFSNKKPKIGFIPSQSDIERKFFKEIYLNWYKQFGIDDLFYFDIDKEYDETKLDELLSCDAIFLSGGNSYYFLNSLQKHNFLPILKKFVEDGGILIGASAGSILMSKTISIVTIDENIGGDQNDIGLKDFSALDLNDFEFFPHFDKNDQEIIKRMKEYSLNNNSIIYACNDGGGIIVDDDKIKYIGEVFKIENGKIEML
ncbi:MAG: Type 1 glutamine amidotransferase-like domain-containing protein [Candidatus Paceibacterota bacterium]|jgi:dipeptidase E